eukprot:1217380-Amphidinium_carterae.1
MGGASLRQGKYRFFAFLFATCRLHSLVIAEGASGIADERNALWMLQMRAERITSESLHEDSLVANETMTVVE